MDHRDLRSNLITSEEWDEFEKIGNDGHSLSVEEWRRRMLRERSNARLVQRSTRSEGEWSPVVQVVATKNRDSSSSGPGRVRTEGFRPPRPRVVTARREYRAPGSRRPRVRKPDRRTQLRGAWGNQWMRQEEMAMSAVGLESAVGALNAFAESIPEDRLQLHQHLAAFAVLAKAMAAASEKFKKGLEQPQRDGSPGVPTEVTQFLLPVAEAGLRIADCCADTVNAFEDRFATAIAEASDPEKMSDAFLSSKPA